MPSVSKRQQRFFGMVEAGRLPMPKGMTREGVKEFASTPTGDLPYRAASSVKKRRRRIAEIRAGK